MASPLVPTILNFNHAEVSTQAETRCRPQSVHEGSALARSSGAPEPLGGLEPSEQNLNALARMTMEDPGDDGEFKLPKIQSLAIMLFTNVLLQVGSLCSGNDRHILRPSFMFPRRRFSSSSPLVVNTPNIWVAVRSFPDWLSEFRPSCQG